MRRFLVIVRKRRSHRLGKWFAQATADDVPEPIQRFARGLKSDWEAVSAGLTLPWSNPASEGHIIRLKVIKRQMYGRAKFDLLRARVLAAA